MHSDSGVLLCHVIYGDSQEDFQRVRERESQSFTGKLTSPSNFAADVLIALNIDTLLITERL